jgi:hypothetical protein
MGMNFKINHPLIGYIVDSKGSLILCFNFYLNFRQASIFYRWIEHWQLVYDKKEGVLSDSVIKVLQIYVDEVSSHMQILVHWCYFNFFQSHIVGDEGRKKSGCIVCKDDL